MTRYVTSEHPNAEPRYRARYFFHPNSIKMASGNAHHIFYGYPGTSNVILRNELRFFSGKYHLRIGFLKDDGTWKNSSWFSINNAWNNIEFDWRAETAAGANNGGVMLWINGVQKVNFTTYDTDTRRIDLIRLGPVAGIDTGTRNIYFFDEFVSKKINPIDVVSSISVEGENLQPGDTPLDESSDQNALPSP